MKNMNGYSETKTMVEKYVKKDGAWIGSGYWGYWAFYSTLYYGGGNEYSGSAHAASANYAAPVNTTGWFMPSIGQWVVLVKQLGGYNGEILGNMGFSVKCTTSGSGTSVVNKLNEALKKVSGAQQITDKTTYWASSELARQFAANILFNSSDGYLWFNYYDDFISIQKDCAHSVRCILAF